MRVYLDNAATTFPKPPEVADAVAAYLMWTGTAYGRGATRTGEEVRRTIERLRRQLAGLLNAPDPRSIVFTYSGTDGLNLLLRGTLRPDDHVVTTVIEHNSTLRPLRHLEDDGIIEVTRIDCDAEGIVDSEAIIEAVRPDTRLVAVSHVSNVTGAIQPIGEIGERLLDHSALFLVDAAQSAGVIPIDVRGMGIDLLACPGHKGLLGPLGTGVAFIRSDIAPQVTPLRLGGTGSRSEDDRQPDDLPDRFEAGNHNVPGLIGLAAGVEWLLANDPAAIRTRERELTERFRSAFEEFPSWILHGPRSAENRVGIVSFDHPAIPPDVLATILEDRGEIETRAGFHCSPSMHRALGTFADGGSVRASLGPFTTDSDVDRLIEMMREIDREV